MLSRLSTSLRQRWTLRIVGVTAIALCLVASPTTSAGERLALLIGNENYQADVGPLKNPCKDIETVGNALAKVGFRPHYVRNATFDVLHKEIKNHITRVQRAGADTVSFIYYSGHGAADEGGVNYLIPVNVTTTDTTSVWNSSTELKADPVDKLVAQAPSATHYVVFDDLEISQRRTRDHSNLPRADSSS